MSITRHCSEDEDEDSEHSRICKKVSNHLESSRKLLVYPEHPNERPDSLRSEDLFTNFLKDMPLPCGYEDSTTLPIATLSFDFKNFMNGGNTNLISSSEGNFWEAMYIMEQESN